MTRSLFGKLLLTYLAVVLLTLLLLGLLLTGLLQWHFAQRRQVELIARGRELSLLAAQYLTGQMEEARLRSWLRTTSRLMGAQILIVDARGRPRAYSSGVRGRLPDFVPGIPWPGAADGLPLVRRDVGELFGQRVVTVAIPVRGREGGVLGAVVLGAPIADVTGAARGVIRLLAWAALPAAVVAAGVAYWFSGRLTKPLVRMESLARRMAEGRFDQRLSVDTGDELGKLAQSFNYLAERLQRTIAELRSEKSRMEHMVTSMAEGVVAVDESGQVMAFNPAARRLLGWEGNGLPALGDLDPSVRELLQQAQQTGSSRRLLRSGGRSIMVRATRITDEGGRSLGIVCLLNDVTESVRAEEMQRQFVANVSHELRTPLTSIRGFVEPLLDGTVEDPERQRKYLEIIRQETIRLTNLIAELLELTRLETGAEALRIARVDFAELVEDALVQMEAQWRRKELQVDTELGESLWVEVDGDRMRQVLLNLLDNAIRYTPPGGKIQIKAQLAADQLKVSVSDTGVGIPPEELPRIWQRFYKVDRARARDDAGTGLGLSIVKHIVEAHGGQVWADSTPGRGTTVGFSIPVRPGGEE